MRASLSILTLIATILLSAPIAVFAQSEQDDLRDAIQASVLADPRVANIPPSQLKELIDALVQQAQAQKMAVSDILWQPGRAEAATVVSGGGTGAMSECEAGWEGYLCHFNRVFGFEGGSYEIPIIILVTSGLLLAVIWEIRIHHRKKMEKIEKAAKKAAASSPPQKIVQ